MPPKASPKISPKTPVLLKENQEYKIDGMAGGRPISIDVVYWQSLTQWSPRPGDWVFYSGFFFTRWVGFVIGSNETHVTIRYHGLPVLLLTTKDEKYKKINIDKIQKSRGGKYMIFRTEQNSPLPLLFVG